MLLLRLVLVGESVPLSHQGVPLPLYNGYVSARLRSRGFCPIDKSTILWDTTQPECILLQAGGVNEIFVCATK
jgi:hypothetical protein